MKKCAFLFVALLISYSAIAQSRSEQKADAEAKKIRDEVFGSSDKDFAVTAVPENLKKESAVIICQKLTQVFDKEGADIGIGSNKSLSTTETIRKRIKLQDKSAVEAFSEFYFKNTKDIGILIEKPDGRKTEINLKEAVEVSDNTRIPTIYRSYYSFSYKYKKIAIPDLQPGDIIDYFYRVSESYFIPQVTQFAFNDVIVSLANTYPTLKQKIEFNVEKQFYINIKSLNGAPTLTPENQKEGNYSIYTMVLENQDKQHDERWVYPYRSTPTVKYQVFFLRSEGSKTNYVVGERGKPKTSITPDEAVEQITNIYEDAPSSLAQGFSYELGSYVTDKLGKETDPVKIAYAAYSYLRGLISVPAVVSMYPGYLDQPYESVKAALSDPDLYGPSNETINDEIFTKIIARVLKNRKIEFRVAFAVPRHIGNLEDAILANEFMWGLHVEGAKPFFLFAPSSGSLPGEIDARMQGVDAYLFNPISKSGKKYEIKKIAVSSHEQNATMEKLTVTFDESMELAAFNRNVTVKGLNKDPYYNSTIIVNDFLDTEMTEYKLKPKYIYKGKKDKMAIIDAGVKSAREEAVKNRKDSQKAELEDNGFEIGTYDSFDLVSDGREKAKPEIKFTEKFTVKNLIKKAGPTYILDAGKIIGEQLEVKEDELKRHYDIYMSNTRSFNYEIAVTIPEGYKVEGIDKLNKDVDNATGFFKSTAKVEGNQLIITASKAYKTIYEKKENWPEMVKFLDEAYKFTQVKVVLKKA
ncbi:MAG: DUF3857 domain-containing protein [Bacteroidia bacterium]|nr:DUF3857 domain-containing protein [Bacteroidia bacterium]